MIWKFARWLNGRVALPRAWNFALGALLMLVLPALCGLVICADPVTGGILFAADVYLFTKFAMAAMSSDAEHDGERNDEED